MMDKEILDKYIDLRDSCLDDSERKQAMEMLYDYKDVFDSGTDSLIQNIF